MNAPDSRSALLTLLARISFKLGDFALSPDAKSAYSIDWSMPM
jgi:hypothetical protein